MEKADRDLILHISTSNTHLKELYEEHLKLEREVEKYEHYARYSTSAQLRQKELKKAKLKGMDDIMTILNEHRQQEAVAA